VSPDVAATLFALVDRLVHAERAVDQRMWLDAVAALVEPCALQHRITPRSGPRVASTPPSPRGS
jgi:hypothetical protein